MELQKEQLRVEKAKAEATKAKVDLAMDYDEDEAAADSIKRRRKKRSFIMNPDTQEMMVAYPASSQGPKVSIDDLISLLKAAKSLTSPSRHTLRVATLSI